MPAVLRKPGLPRGGFAIVLAIAFAYGLTILIRVLYGQ